MNVYTGINDQLKALKAAASAQNLRGGHPHQSIGSSHLIVTISAWLEAMSPQQRNRKFSVTEVISLAGLKGQYRALPAERDVAHALRAVGFKPCRDWTIAGRNKRYWKLNEV